MLEQVFTPATGWSTVVLLGMTTFSQLQKKQAVEKLRQPDPFS
ncbi:hypothetical protein HMPREF9374_1965 [Desmospora sp. 8437]|nr:hypothetical protein HMPREF9374_1965 [Desmospora sp. 8437]